MPLVGAKTCSISLKKCYCNRSLLCDYSMLFSVCRERSLQRKVSPYSWSLVWLLFILPQTSGSVAEESIPVQLVVSLIVFFYADSNERICCRVLHSQATESKVAKVKIRYCTYSAPSSYIGRVLSAHLMKSVWPDWAIFEKFWWHDSSQNYPNIYWLFGLLW